MMWDHTRLLFFLVPPNFVGAAGISAKDKAKLPYFLDDLSILKRLHAGTITGTEKEEALVLF